MERTADMRNCLWRSNADRKVGIFLMYIASGTGQAVPETIQTIQLVLATTPQDVGINDLEWPKRS
jgi:hypothetical protein